MAPKTYPTPTPEQLQLLAQLFDDGATMLEMMRHTEIRRTCYTVKHWLSLIGRVSDHARKHLFRKAGQREQMLARMQELHARGYSCALIGRQLGVKDTMVRAWLQKVGVDTSARTELFPWQEEAIRKLHSEGATFTQIMDAVGVTSGTVARWLKDLGLPSPPRPGWNQPKPKSPATHKEEKPKKVPLKRKMPVFLEPTEKRPANMVSIADRFKYQAPPPPPEYKGFRVINLGRVNPNRRLSLHEIMSVDITGD